MKLKKVFLSIASIALVFGAVLVAIPKTVNKVSASKSEVAVNKSRKKVTHRFTYTRSYEIKELHYACYGGNSIARTLIYSVNGGEEQKVKMNISRAEEGIITHYEWSYDIQVQKGDVVTYKIVHYTNLDITNFVATDIVTTLDKLIKL